MSTLDRQGTSGFRVDAAGPVRSDLVRRRSMAVLAIAGVLGTGALTGAGIAAATSLPRPDAVDRPGHTVSVRQIGGPAARPIGRAAHRRIDRVLRRGRTAHRDGVQPGPDGTSVSGPTGTGDAARPGSTAAQPGITAAHPGTLGTPARTRKARHLPRSFVMCQHDESGETDELVGDGNETRRFLTPVQPVQSAQCRGDAGEAGAIYRRLAQRFLNFDAAPVRRTRH